MSQIRINPEQHLIHPHRVKTLCADFELEDVWQVPVELSGEQSLKMFMDSFKKTEGGLLQRGPAAILFRVRLALGRIFGWDDQPDANRAGSIRARYAQEEKLKLSDLPAPGHGSFVPVYQLENEFLSEIENTTVHATLHFSRVPLREKVWTIHMAIYVKPKGIFGKMYMLLIKPFRLWIIYPAMMKAVGKRWNRDRVVGNW